MKINKEFLINIFKERYNFEIKIIDDCLIKSNIHIKSEESNYFFTIYIFLRLNSFNEMKEINSLTDLIWFIPKNSQELSISDEFDYREAESYENAELNDYNIHIWSFVGKYLKDHYKENFLFFDFSNHALCISDEKNEQILDILNKNYLKKNGKFEEIIALLLVEYLKQYIYWKESGLWPLAWKLKNDKKSTKIEQKHLKNLLMEKISNK